MAIGRLLGQRLKVRLHYRTDFLVTTIGEVLLAGAGLVFLQAMFGHVDRLGGWSRAEVLFCWGFAEAVVGVFHVFFQGLWHLNLRYILGGDLDRLLLRPMDAYVQVLLEHLALEDLPLVALGVGVMIWAAADLPPIPASRWLLAPLLVVAGACVLGGVLTAVVSLGFHLHHRGTAIGLVYQLASFNRYPLELFARPLRFLLTWVLPLAFAGFYPAAFLLHRPGYGAMAAITPLVALLSMAGGQAMFRWGLARYASTGT